jgi:hypothetical protein
MELNSKNEEFEKSLIKQILEQKQEILTTLNSIEENVFVGIKETDLIVALSKFRMFKFFIKPLNR